MCAAPPRVARSVASLPEYLILKPQVCGESFSTTLYVKKVARRVMLMTIKKRNAAFGLENGGTKLWPSLFILGLARQRADKFAVPFFELSDRLRGEFIKQQLCALHAGCLFIHPKLASIIQQTS